ncbi:hypothetical protein PR048_032284 [Dryococelus australis]|uniref:Uncharacterized protein n=1 Tax=Dryococelus australis TaxID=614101 RepID=A0ABQ9G4M7_9NEOP|nr:hypothetical protein PR048_032284 [Dryococelus australis]
MLGVRFHYAVVRQQQCSPMDWPAQSPDLNPIEHLWDELDRRVRARQARPKSIAQLMEWLQEEWRRIPADVLQTLVESMPDRAAVVIAARAWQCHPNRSRASRPHTRRATVAERLARSPPNKAIRVQSPAGSLRIFACGNRAGRCRWPADFLGELPFPRPFHSGAASYPLQSSSLALKTSLLIAAQIPSLKRGKKLEVGGSFKSNFDPSPLARSTFFTVTLGMTFNWLSFMAGNQGMIQKLITLPDMHSAKRAVISFGVGNILIKTVTLITGLAIYATYYDCDPLHTKTTMRQECDEMQRTNARMGEKGVNGENPPSNCTKLSKADQVVPYFVMETAGSIPGLPGLFIAGIFSAALSTMSSHLNCLSATFYEDFVLPFVNKKTNLEKKAHVVLKIIVVLFGLMCVLMVYVIEHMGAIFDVSSWLKVYCCEGAAEGAWLERSHPTKGNLTRSQAGPLPDFRTWESCSSLCIPALLHTHLTSLSLTIKIPAHASQMYYCCQTN